MGRKQPIGLQTLELAETYNKNISDPYGFCGLWSYYSIFFNRYINSIYDNVNSVEGSIGNGTYWLRTMRNSKFSLKDIIRSFGRVITNFRDDILAKEFNTDCNLLLYSNKSEKEQNEIIYRFHHFINTLIPKT